MKLGKATAMVSAVVFAACAHDEPEIAQKASGPIAGTSYTVQIADVVDVTWVPAVAEPRAAAVLSTKLLGTITAVHVREGDYVRAGQALVTIDSRDLNARGAQISASIEEAEAVRREAATNANRVRALYAEEAAARAQLDAAESALARADAGVRAANAARAEWAAARSYSEVRAPFAGLITARMVDPGAFAAPGAPLLRIEDAAQLRVRGTASPEIARALRRGAQVDVRIESATARGVVEAIVPAAGNLYHVNVVIANPSGALLAGGAASIGVPQGVRSAVRIPANAIQNVGDLTGVHVVTEQGSELRWVQVGESAGSEVEVIAGLRSGEKIIIPARASGAI